MTCENIIIVSSVIQSEATYLHSAFSSYCFNSSRLLFFRSFLPFSVCFLVSPLTPTSHFYRLALKKPACRWAVNTTTNRESHNDYVRETCVTLLRLRLAQTQNLRFKSQYHTSGKLLTKYSINSKIYPIWYLNTFELPHVLYSFTALIYWQMMSKKKKDI